jgi:uncharacterized protein YegP (UPF0339 family)
MSDESEDLLEVWLQAQADQIGITDQVTELIRSVLRGIASVQAGSAANNILEKKEFISNLVARSEAFDEKQAIIDAIKSFSEQDNLDPIEEAYFQISMAGLKWLAERSARDTFADARTSKCRSELLRSVQLLHKLRTKNRRF